MQKTQNTPFTAPCLGPSTPQDGGATGRGAATPNQPKPRPHGTPATAVARHASPSARRRPPFPVLHGPVLWWSLPAPGSTRRRSPPASTARSFQTFQTFQKPTPLLVPVPQAVKDSVMQLWNGTIASVEQCVAGGADAPATALRALLGPAFQQFQELYGDALLLAHNASQLVAGVTHAHTHTRARARAAAHARTQD